MRRHKERLYAIQDPGPDFFSTWKTVALFESRQAAEAAMKLKRFRDWPFKITPVTKEYVVYSSSEDYQKHKGN